MRIAGPTPALPSEDALEPPRARALREELVASIEATGHALRPRVVAAMRKVPRHRFVEEATLEEAYLDAALAIGEGQSISQPSVVAVMSEALDVGPRHRVLEIGTGSGYQAAVLSVLASEVYTVEILPTLAARATRVLKELGYRNVHVRTADGYAGWPEHAPFDRILLTAAPPELPRALLDQLADGGVLVAPVGREWGPQWLVRVRRSGDALTREPLERVRFVPMVAHTP